MSATLTNSAPHWSPVIARWLLVALAASFPARVSAEEPPGRTTPSADERAISAARTDFRNGVALARAGELNRAIDAFERAYRVSPNYAVLYNLGQAYAVAGRTVDAVRTLTSFLEAGGNRIEPQRRVQVEEQIARERAGLGRVEILVMPVGADVFVDGSYLGVTPLSALELAPGRHLLVARLAGHESAIEPFDVDAGRIVQISAQLTTKLDAKPEGEVAKRASGEVRSPAGPPEQARAYTPAPLPHEARRTAATIALGVGAVMLVGASATIAVWNDGRYARWRREQSRFDAAVAGGASGPEISRGSSALGTEAARIQRTDDIAIGLALAAGGALVSAGIVWFSGRAKLAHD